MNHINSLYLWTVALHGRMLLHAPCCLHLSTIFKLCDCCFLQPIIALFLFLSQEDCWSRVTWKKNVLEALKTCNVVIIIKGSYYFYNYGYWSNTLVNLFGVFILTRLVMSSARHPDLFSGVKGLWWQMTVNEFQWTQQRLMGGFCK